MLLIHKPNKVGNVGFVSVYDWLVSILDQAERCRWFQQSILDRVERCRWFQQSILDRVERCRWFQQSILDRVEQCRRLPIINIRPG